MQQVLLNGHEMPRDKIERSIIINQSDAAAMLCTMVVSCFEN